MAKVPYPIPIKDCFEGDPQRWWNFYHGNIIANGVEFEEKIMEIFSKGFFGKGSLSKGGPTFIKSTKENEENKLESHLKNGEKLILSYEEAFFLMFAVPSIIVKDNDIALNIDQAWDKFSELSISQHFPTQYAVYHHFRSKGWVVKSGLKFGADYVIYKDGPPYNHAQYSVLIKTENEFKNSVKSSNKLTWLQLGALNRVNANCGKEILICNIWVPKDTKTPSCLFNFKIQEIIFKRWVGAEERTIGKKEDLKIQKKN